MKPGGPGEALHENEANDRSATLHGVLVKVFGSGVLIIGESGIGKSSCALELVSRGHLLIADDVISAEEVDGKVVGSAPARFAGLLEVRDLGIVDVRDLFGTGAFAPHCTIDLCVEFVNRERSADHPFTPEYRTFELIGSQVGKLTLAAGPGRSLPILIETAVRLARSRSSLNTVAEDHDDLCARALA